MRSVESEVSRLSCNLLISDDRINISSFACANNAACVHVEMKIVLTMKKASLGVAVLAQDETGEEERQRRDTQRERDEMLINGLDRFARCLSFPLLLFPRFSSLSSAAAAAASPSRFPSYSIII